MHYQSLLALFLFANFLLVKLYASMNTQTLQQVFSSFYEKVNYIDRLTSDEKKISVFKPEKVDLQSDLSEKRKKWLSQYATRFKQTQVDEIVKKTAETNKDIQASYTLINSIEWNKPKQKYQELLTNLRNWVTFYTTYKNEFLATVNAKSQNSIASNTSVTTTFDTTIKNPILEELIVSKNNPKKTQKPRFKITPMRIVLNIFFCLFVLSIVYFYRK